MLTTDVPFYRPFKSEQLIFFPVFASSTFFRFGLTAFATSKLVPEVDPLVLQHLPAFAVPVFSVPKVLSCCGSFLLGPVFSDFIIIFKN